MDHTTDQNNVRRVAITARGDRADIEIDGTRIDPSAVKAYSVNYFAGEWPEVLLQVADRGDTRWSGMARVAVADLPDPGPAAALFLDAIDPEALERAALSRPDLGIEPYSLTKAMLTQLGEWARGL
ncbi:hypothetical protein [Streptomyces sp. NBC_00557]|uniref:hypothetical protein n=1 Tax=Streptomyces sp. NBC_00557 TaxID=2975776 RepID=UPI002E7FF214|nr:hypothetical protein [Streptomyces sp. NBC_00557]WUC37173.1 hypothetical protein OG956_24660 [Streptomyces sp. NBC_00557]